MSARIEELCRTLRLSGLAASVRDLDPGPCSEEITGFLLQALENEYDLRLERKRVSAIRTAGFPTMKRFDDLVVDLLPEDARSYLSLLKELQFLKEHQNVLMIGNSGTGKTHLAIATWCPGM